MATEDIEIDLLFRRLRENDKTELEAFCKADESWNRYFPNHNAWLARAISELHRPGRTAIGAFSPSRNESGALANRLQACLFLKLSDYDDAAELKNVVLSGRVSDDSYRRILLESLINKAIRYCEVREIGKLEIEIPQLEHKLISLFLGLGFRIAALRERYFPGQNVCVLEKEIGETYNADPFDLLRVGKWLIRSLLPSRFMKQFLCEINGVDGPPCLVFEVYPLHPAFSPKNAKGFDNRLCIALVVLDEPWNTESAITSILDQQWLRPYQLRYVLGENLSANGRVLLKNAGVNFFDLEEVREISGGLRSSLSIPIQQEEIGGVITVLELEMIERYASYEGEFVYYLLSGLGAVLYKPDLVEDSEDTDAELLLGVYCPHWRDGRRGIVAISEITAIGRAPIDEADAMFPETPRPITKGDLEYYRTRGDREDIPVLKCKRMTVFPEPLEFGSRVWRNHEAVRDYLSRELRSPVNSVYMDYGTADMLRNQASIGSADQYVRSSSALVSLKNSIAFQPRTNDVQRQAVLDVLSRGLVFIADCSSFLESLTSPKEIGPKPGLSREGDFLLIRRADREALRITAAEIQLREWNFQRFESLMKHAHDVWRVYHTNYAAIAILAEDEKARIRVRMTNDLETLREDMTEMLKIAENALGRDIREYIEVPPVKSL